MKLYYSRGACSLGPRIIINELGLKAEFESVDLKTKVTESGSNFLEINSKGAVPTLVIDNKEVLTEAAVILQYLAYAGRSTSLLPPENDFTHFRVLEALNYIATEMHKGVGVLFNAKIPQSLKDEIYIPLILTKLDYLNKRLAKTKYLVGDNFTLPDAYLFTVLRWVHHFKIDMQAYPNVLRYFKELGERPSVIKALQDEGLTSN